MAANPNFTWTSTTPGRWERDVDEAEQFYTSLAKAYEGTGRNFFAMTGFISLSIPLPESTPQAEAEKNLESALRKAWTHLRYDHPTIASRVVYDADQKKCKKVYHTFSPSYTVQDWLDETFIVVDEGISGLEWCNSDPPVPDFPTLFFIKTGLHDGRIGGDLVLRSHHDIIDGMGTLLLFHNFLSHTARAHVHQGQNASPGYNKYEPPHFGDEYKNLSPPLCIAAQIPRELDEAHKHRMSQIQKYNATLREKNVELACPPFKREHEGGPGKHQRVAIRLSQEETTSVVAACRELGLSITHAYHAAIPLVVRDQQEKRESERQVRYLNYSLINERGNCVEPYSTSSHPAAVYHSVSGKGLAVDLTVPALETRTRTSTSTKTSTDIDSGSASNDSILTQRKEYANVASTIRKFYLDTRADKDHIFLVPSYWKMGTIPYPADGKTRPVPARNETPSVSISSMGILDKVIGHRYGEIEVEEPWVTGEELGTGLGLFLGTWKGRVTLSAAYNDAWHDKEEVVEFINKCNEVTLSGLGLQS